MMLANIEELRRNRDTPRMFGKYKVEQFWPLCARQAKNVSNDFRQAAAGDGERQTPLWLRFKETRDPMRLRQFGCRVVIATPPHEQRTLLAKGREGLYVGYSTTCPGWLILFPPDREGGQPSLRITEAVVFDEHIGRPPLPSPLGLPPPIALQGPAPSAAEIQQAETALESTPTPVEPMTQAPPAMMQVEPPPATLMQPTVDPGARSTCTQTPKRVSWVVDEQDELNRAMQLDVAAIAKGNERGARQTETPPG